MNKLVVAAVAAMFAFAVNASSEKPAAPQAAAAGKQMSKEECDRAMADCKDEACKEKLRNDNGCK